MKQCSTTTELTDSTDIEYDDDIDDDSSTANDSINEEKVEEKDHQQRDDKEATEDDDDDDLPPPSNFVCPLTLEVMRDPVVSRYGLSFERAAILEWLAAGHETCPLTRQPLRMSGLISNQTLRLQIRMWQTKINSSSSSNGESSSNSSGGIYGTTNRPQGDDENSDHDDDDDTEERPVMIYFSLPNATSDNTEHGQDDPYVIFEANRVRHIQRMMRHAGRRPATNHRRRRPRVNNAPAAAGFLGRMFAARRAMAA